MISPDLVEVLKLTSDTPTLFGHEHKAVATYNAAVEGIEDVLDVIEARHFREVEAELGTDIARADAHGHFTTLTIWHDALDGLYGDLAYGRGQRHSEFARRLVEHEANRFFRALNLLRREVCTWLLGTAGPQPEVDAGVLTFCDVPARIHLDGTALAESS